MNDVRPPKHRGDVQAMVDEGNIQDLHDSEYQRMLDEIGKRVVAPAT